MLYRLAKAIGAMRSDGSDSRLPAKRMPTGLIDIKSSSKTQDKTLFKLAWQIQKLEELTKDIRQLVVELKTCKERVHIR